MARWRFACRLQCGVGCHLGRRLILMLIWTVTLSATVHITSSSSIPPSSASSSPAAPSPDTMWQHKADFDHLLIPPTSDNMFRFVSAQTRGACAMACHMRPWCAAFFHRTEGSEATRCLLDSVVARSVSRAVPSHGYSYYLATNGWCNETEGFVFYPGGPFCFRVYQEVVRDWVTAHARCKSRGMQLVVPANHRQMLQLLGTIQRTPEFGKRNTYLGIVRPMNQWDKPWPDGVPQYVGVDNITVSLDTLRGFWVKKNPNNQKNKQNCVQADRKRGNFLNDLSCNYKNYYICQRKLSLPIS